MKQMTQGAVKNIVAFCILMENNNGILSKSPKYIEEKFIRYCFSQVDETEWGLDSSNRKKLKDWENEWFGKDK